MLVFIDESGCPGFKFSQGSDPVFGIGMVIFSSADDARSTQEAIQSVREELHHRPEFKFTKSRHELRDAFFSAVARCPFVVRALMVHKEMLYSGHLRTDAEAFYSYFAKMLMKHDGRTLKSASVRIDGSGSPEFQRVLGSYLHRGLGDRIKDVRMSDSARDPLMQLADMCIGAITRAERNRQDPARWRTMLAPRIADIWRFR
jgi:hypothetical protein